MPSAEFPNSALITSLRLEHHITDLETPPRFLKEEQTEKISLEFLVWKSNDGLLITWLKGMMTENVISMSTDEFLKKFKGL